MLRPVVRVRPLCTPVSRMTTPWLFLSPRSPVSGQRNGKPARALEQGAGELRAVSQVVDLARRVDTGERAGAGDAADQGERIGSALKVNDPHPMPNPRQRLAPRSPCLRAWSPECPSRSAARWAASRNRRGIAARRRREELRRRLSQKRCHRFSWTSSQFDLRSERPKYWPHKAEPQSCPAPLPAHERMRAQTGPLRAFSPR